MFRLDKARFGKDRLGYKISSRTLNSRENKEIFKFYFTDWQSKDKVFL